MTFEYLKPIILLSIIGFIGVNIKDLILFIKTYAQTVLFSYVKIEDSSEFYYIIQKYISIDKKNDVKNFYVRTFFDDKLEGDNNLLYNLGLLVIKFNGSKIFLHKKSTELKSSISAFKTHKQEIELYSFNRENLLAFIDMINEKYGSDLKLYFNNNGSVQLLSIIQQKTFNNIFLNDGLVEKIKTDLDLFIKNKTKYDILGLKYKHVYLFYGEAGTGKSSLVNAIANYTKRPILSINKSKDMTDETLINLIASRPNKSIISFEDIDCLFDDLDRVVTSNVATKEDSKNKLTLSCLLNILDGAYTPNDTIFILTTNYIDKLDDAIKRDGRTNLMLEITKPNDDTKLKYIEFIKSYNPNILLNIDDYKNKTLASIEKEFLNYK